MEIVSVFDYGDLPRDLQEVVCDGQPNDSFRRVWLKGDVSDNLDKVAKWALTHGAVHKADDKYAYVLFSISW